MGYNEVLTAKQLETYQFIKRYILHHGIAPTEAEIAEGIGINSRGVVHRYVTALAQQGLIQVTANRKRNIHLSSQTSENFTLQILGKIAAGKLIKELTSYKLLNIADKLFSTNRFLLRVEGDSMIEDNICDGDFVLCEKCESNNLQEIAVIVVNTEITLKQIKNNSDGTITLVSSNPTVKEQVYPAEAIQVQGIYVGLLRFCK